MNYEMLYSHTQPKGRFLPKVHSMGNGRLLVYGSGLNITEVYSPYTSPVMLNLKLTGDNFRTETTRKDNSFVIINKLYSEEKLCAEIYDVIHESKCCFKRKIKCINEFNLVLDFPGKTQMNVIAPDFNARYNNISFVKEHGNPIFFHISAFSYYGNVLFSKNINFSITEDSKILLTINDDCEIMFSASMDFDENILALKTLENDSFEAFEEKSIKVKKSFKERRHFRTCNKVLSEIIDDAEAMFYSQQSYDGGIVSSNNLNFGFSRDDYGPGRGYLALGHYNECRNILEYKFSKWKKFGNFQNADGLGVDFPRHPCDNLEVEQTSYMMLLARDYYRKTRDNIFILRIFPMLTWILKIQIPLLKKNMLPFNGDETYIAGGLLKRGCIFQGAAEATLMFILCCEWLIEWAADNGKEKEVQEFIVPMTETKKHFRNNFFENGKLYANNPERSSFEELPKHRHGVCEYTDPYNELHFGYIYHDGSGHYACEKCLGRKYQGNETPDKTELAAVYLELGYLDTDLFSKYEMLNMARKYIKKLDVENDIIIGYEPALLLYTLCKCGGTKEEIVFARDLVLKHKEKTGSWAEYYKNFNSDFSSPHRPWETGYSLESLIEADKILGNERV